MNAQKNGATMRKVLRYIRKYWFYFALSLFFAAVTVTLTLYLPILIGQAVDLILAPADPDRTGGGSYFSARSGGFRGNLAAASSDGRHDRRHRHLPVDHERVQ